MDSNHRHRASEARALSNWATDAYLICWFVGTERKHVCASVRRRFVLYLTELRRRNAFWGFLTERNVFVICFGGAIILSAPTKGYQSIYARVFKFLRPNKRIQISVVKISYYRKAGTDFFLRNVFFPAQIFKRGIYVSQFCIDERKQNKIVGG